MIQINAGNPDLWETMRQNGEIPRPMGWFVGRAEKGEDKGRGAKLQETQPFFLQSKNTK
jgi:hypothetical protein